MHPPVTAEASSVEVKDDAGEVIAEIGSRTAEPDAQKRNLSL
jgi:hypothetical protein